MGEETKLQIGKDLLTLAQASRHLAETSLAHKDWSGLPVPVAGLNLVLEPRYKHKHLSEFRWKECYDENGVRHVFDEEPPATPSEYRQVNAWWNARYQVTIAVLKDKQGRSRFGVLLEDRLSFTLRTLDAASVWPIEAEQKAQKKLATLIPEDLFELYQLTGHLPEISKRSQLTYLFRKGRPTIVMRQTEEESILLFAPFASTQSGIMGIHGPVLCARQTK